MFVDPFWPFPHNAFNPMFWFSLTRELRRTSERVTPLSVGRNIDKRLARLESTFGIYEQTGLVITSRLHVALPCIALKTPFIFLSHFFEALDERGTNNSFNLY